MTDWLLWACGRIGCEVFGRCNVSCRGRTACYGKRSAGVADRWRAYQVKRRAIYRANLRKALSGRERVLTNDNREREEKPVLTTALSDVGAPCSAQLRRERLGLSWGIDCALDDGHAGDHVTAAGQRFE